MKNPNPIARARRIEMRRKQLGYPSRCFYCGETDIFCFEADHPVSEELDKDFKRAVCRNCHRKREASRDIKGLTKNGKHDVVESEDERLRRYLLLMAEDEESQAELLEAAPDTPIDLVIAASHARAASLQRKVRELSLSNPPGANGSGRTETDARQTLGQPTPKRDSARADTSLRPFSYACKK